jgi:hypothetical protein
MAGLSRYRLGTQQEREREENEIKVKARRRRKRERTTTAALQPTAKEKSITGGDPPSQPHKTWEHR